MYSSSAIYVQHYAFVFTFLFMFSHKFPYIGCAFSVRLCDVFALTQNQPQRKPNKTVPAHTIHMVVYIPYTYCTTYIYRSSSNNNHTINKKRRRRRKNNRKMLECSDDQKRRRNSFRHKYVQESAV